MVKKLLIGVSALALTASIAQAQTIGTPPPENLTPYFTLTSPAPPANQSEVNQTFSGNTANVDQTGASSATANNISRIDQGRAGGYVNQNNRADVDQNGAGNKVRIQQVTTSTDNTPSINLLPAVSNLGWYGSDGQLISGSMDNFKVNNGQPGAGNRAVVNQTQTGAVGVGNQAVILQGSELLPPDAGASRSDARIDQTGGENRAIIKQGDNNAGSTAIDHEDGNMLSSIAQTGRNNVAENNQGEIDRSKIVQKGDNNQAYVNQPGQLDSSGTADVYARQSALNQIGSNNVAMVSQTASRNGSVLWQGNDATVYTDQPVTTATFNLATVNQAGTDGYAETWQGVNRNSNFNVAALDQTSTATFAIGQTYQNGNFNIAGTSQSGANDTSFVSQGRQNTNAAGTSQSNTSSLTQRGSSQYGQILQGYNADSDSNISIAIQDTAAANAQAYVQQEGAGSNWAGTYQGGGGGEYSSIFQSGSTNFTAVNQTGLAANSLASQTGNNNIATIIQSANNVQSTLTTTGNTNTAAINQTVNAGSVSTVTQTGNSNGSTVNQ